MPWSVLLTTARLGLHLHPDFLRQIGRPDYELLPDPLRVVDLFCGCGGLSVGVAEACRRSDRGTDVRLGVDIDETAVQVFAHAFPKADVEVSGVEALLDGELGRSPTSTESQFSDRVGTVDILVGGPPCQGHSDLNNHSRRDDPRNALYLRMARGADVLAARVVVVENVPAVVHDRDGVVTSSVEALRDSGYGVAQRLIDLVELGVPQRRRRHILLAIRDTSDLDAQELLEASSTTDVTGTTVRMAIEDLLQVEGSSPHDTASRASDVNRERMAWLHDNDEYDLPNALRPPCHRDKDHSYTSVYGRMRWDQPAQTITTGFTSMGQGRYVHPSMARTITPHEAARIQGLPDWLDLDGISRRHVSKLIGNAVPPAVTTSIVGELLRARKL